MKVCVYGVGAIGGVIAARLALSGVAVAVVGRGAHIAAIRDNGLRFTIAEASQTVPVAASEDPATFGPQDLVLVAVKAHQLPDIVDGLKLLLKNSATVIYAVNGLPWWYFHGVAAPNAERQLPLLDPGSRLWTEVGVDRTIGCVVNLPGAVIGPGSVRQPPGNNRFALGELTGEPSSRLNTVAAMLRGAGFVVDTHRPIRDEVWGKLAHIMTVSPIAVLTKTPPGLALADPAIRDLARKVYQEAFAIAAAYGCPQNADVETLVNGHRGVNRPSMLQDLEAGRPMEIDPQLTVPIGLAKEAGVPVPTLEFLLGLVRIRAAQAGLYGDGPPPLSN